MFDPTLIATHPLLHRQLQSQVSEALPAAIAGRRSILLLSTVNTPGSAPIKPDQPAAPQNLVWRREIRLEVERQHQTAARPVTGRIPTKAAAIWFENEEEALACLWLWFSQAQPDLPWWGRSLLKYWGITGRRPATCLGQHPRLVPHALRLLERWKMARTALAVLSEGDARGLLLRLTREWDIDWRPPDQESGNLTQTGSRVLNANPFPVKGHQLSIPPLQKRVLIPSSALTSIHLALWFMCHSLADHPYQISKKRLDALWTGVDTAFDRQSREQGQVAESAVNLVTHGETDLIMGGSQHFNIPPPKTGHSNISLQDPSQSRSLNPDMAARSNLDSLPDLNSQDRLSLAYDPMPADPVRVQNFQSRPRQTQPSASTNQNPPINRLVSPAGELKPQTDGISTRLGGLFYLINVMAQLELPTCVEHSCAPESTVGPWELLEGLGRTLLAGSGTFFIDDPVWGLLADLAGRSARLPPGKGLNRFEDLKIPTDWPAETGPVVGSWPDLPSVPLTAFLPKPFSDWLTVVGPLVGRWLTARLSRFQPLPPQWDYVNLFALPAQAVATRTHIDVWLPLESISTRARLAGFDFNPGWQPTWGKVITFYFQPNFRGNP